MPEAFNLAETIERQLPEELVEFLRLAGEAAQSSGQKLYLVGGSVRDLLLGRPASDLDLVLEGDAIGLARRLAGVGGGKITAHPRFGTASLQWNKWKVDLVTARLETYQQPGALPSISPGSIRDDLSRRDFTINALAVELGYGHYGRLLDIYGGKEDLRRKYVRVLHEKSFIDDATRIWRALRYEQRLDFQLEPDTRRWLERDLSYLESVSGDRIRHELELALEEENPEKLLRRAGELGVLAKIHPSLQADGGLAGRFERARQRNVAGVTPAGLYLALLVYSLNRPETEQLIAYLRPRKVTARTLRDTLALKDKLAMLADEGLPDSRLYALLQGFSNTAVMAGALSSDSALVSRRLDRYLGKLRSVKPVLGGEDLKKMGVASGPAIREILSTLLDARLDGKVTTRQQEEALARRLAG